MTDDGAAVHSPNRFRLWLKLLSPIAVVALCFTAVRLALHHHSLSPDVLLTWGRALGIWGPLLLVLALALRPLLLLPGSPFTAVAGMLWGPLAGTALSLTGSALSALVLTTLGRRVLARSLARWSGIDRLRLEKIARQHDLVYALVVSLTPVGQDLGILIASGAGARRIRLILGTVIGNAPGTLVVAMFGRALITGRPALIGLTIGCWVVSSIAAALLARRIWISLKAVQKPPADLPTRPGTPHAGRT